MAVGLLITFGSQTSNAWHGRYRQAGPHHNLKPAGLRALNSAPSKGSVCAIYLDWLESVPVNCEISAADHSWDLSSDNLWLTSSCGGSLSDPVVV
jgi:hypothetical protein